MKMKFATAALALSAVFSASAMQPIADAELSQMTGQDGISIVADMKLNIGALTYKNSSNATSISLRDMSATGLISSKIELVTGDAYTQALTDALTGSGVAAGDAPAVVTGIQTATGYVPGSDVLQVAFPVLPPTAKGALLNVSVNSINTGNGGASMGGLSISDINFGGTRLWIHGH